MSADDIMHKIETLSGGVPIMVSYPAAIGDQPLPLNHRRA